MTRPVKRLVVFAPNWLGDAVMAVPCIDAVRQHYPEAAIAVAARGHLALLFDMVAGVDEVLHVDDVRRLRDGRFDVAILLPNSFRAAWIARRAGIAERWGYAADLRTRLLTRAVERVRGGHQVEYYRRLLAALGIGQAGAPSVHVEVPAASREWARETLTAKGWSAGAPLVGMAPGAAYGTAKQWPPERFAQVAAGLGRDGVATVLVGSRGDRMTCDEVERAATRTSHLAPRTSHAIVNLAGQTDVKQLAAVMAQCRTFVSNDSGAMHLAAAVGIPVVAIFGSTNEHETAPLPIPQSRPGLESHAIVATDAWCRPCMLRECPLDHRCMTAVDVPRVKAEVLKRLEIRSDETGSRDRESGSMAAPNRAVFLDRDGTLNEDVGYLDRFERLRMFPWAIDAVRVLNRAGFKVVVVTNQNGVARGLVSEAFVGEVQREIDARVTAAGGRIDGWYYCPHEPDAAVAAYRRECECRKPRPGMIRQAEADLGIDAARSYVVGDKWGDVELGRNVGARTVLVRTGYGASEERRPPEGTRADYVADNLIEAVTWITRDSRT